MKRLLSVLLALCLLVGAMPLAYAVESKDIDAGEAVETDDGESPAPEESEAPSENQILPDAVSPVVVGTLEELQSAISDAKDGDMIAVSKSIIVDGDCSIGIPGKRVILKQAESFYGNMLQVQDGTVTVTAVDFCGGDFYFHAGGVGCSDGNLIVSQCNFSENLHGAIGVGFGVNSIISDCTFTNVDETVVTSMDQVGDIEIQNCTFEENTVSIACVFVGGTVKIKDCVFKNNISTGGDGVAILLKEFGTYTVSDCTFIGNKTKIGKGAAILNGADLTISKCLFWQNESDYAGDDIYNYCDGTTAILDTDQQLTELYIDNGLIYDGAFEDTGVERNLDGFYHDGEPYDTRENRFVDCDISTRITLPVTNYTGGIHVESHEYIAAEPDTKPQEPDDSQETQPPTDQGDTETPQEPPTSPPEGDTDSGNDYTPPAYWWPSTPSTPSTRPAPKEEDIPDNDTPLVDAPFLTCGSAVIDTSQSVVLAGYGDGLLHEDDPLTRAQAAQIIYRLLTAESAGQLYTLQNAFTDVPAAAWYNEAVSTIANAGIVVGCGNGLYCPDDNLTWAQALTILTRFVEVQEYDLQHITYDGWALQAVQTAAALGWIEDSADLSVNAIITRGDFAELFNSVLEMY